VTIVDVGKNERVDELLEVGHHAVGHCLRHQLPRALEGLGLQVGTVLEDVPKALVEDRRRPPRAHDAGVAETDEQVTKRRRIEHACVVEDDERHSNLVAEAVLLCFGGELVEHLLPLGLVALLVRDEIGGLHPAVRADHAEGDLAFVEETDEVRARDVQEVGGLLGRELSVHGDDRDGVAVRHLAEDLEEQLEGLAGDRRGDRTTFALRMDLDGSRG